MTKKNEITARSSAAEHLTFIAATGDNPESVTIAIFRGARHFALGSLRER